MRINKYIAQSGYTSRRKADELIEKGKVKVNGVKLSEPGYDVLPDDRVEVEGHFIEGPEKPVYYLINKPLGVVTTVSDEKDRFTVLDILTDVTVRTFPVGRLDYNTSGALIMTNDGELAYKITHPKHELYKKYVARVAGVLSNERVNKLRKGVDIGGYITAPAKVNVLKGDSHSTVVEISIREGKNHQVRKMLQAVGNPVQELTRTEIGEIKLGHLQVGGYRKLTHEEIEYLKSL